MIINREFQTSQSHPIINVAGLIFYLRALFSRAMLLLRVGFFSINWGISTPLHLLIFVRQADKFDKKAASKCFEEAYDWVQDKLVERLHAYAKLWPATPLGDTGP